MKMSLCVTSGISLALSLSAVALGQHYTQVNLVSNTSSVAPVTDPTLINPLGPVPQFLQPLVDLR
jgi:hypothetical protein